MAGVLIVGDASDGAVAAQTLEAAAAGAPLAQALGEPLLGALIGDDAIAAADEFRAGLSALYLIGGKHYRPYTAAAYIAATRAAIDACKPAVVLFAHTLQTREWVPQLAAQLDTGLVMDCTGFTIESSDLVVVKPVYGGGVLAQIVIRGAPRLATIRAGVFEPQPGEPARETIRLDVAPPAPGRVTFLDEAAAAASGGVKLKDAKIIVAGGRGVGGPDHWHFIEEAAAALGAAVGCSRPVADAGWISSAHQVGLSGTSVRPDLYVAVGISGAVQHLAGISSASTVVAINSDPEADMFSRANYGVVGDYREVLPAFVERLKQLRAGSS